jgi:AhpD family alkylhydroperoxidase
MSIRASYVKLNRPAIDALAGFGKQITSIDEGLRALVELRVSQINGCVFCLDRHSMEARETGCSQQRLDCLAAWRESRLFSEPERAALEWAEALTNVSQTHAPDAVYDGLIPHFSENQIVDLSLIIAAMNAWNRLAIGHRVQPARR